MTSIDAGARPMIATRSWDLEPRELDALFTALRFRYHKWDTFACGTRLVLPESIVLDEALHQRIVVSVEGLHRALLRFEDRVCGNPDALDRMGIPKPLHPLVAERATPRLQCARYDLFPTEDGRLMVSEFNEDVPGGFNEAHGIPELLGDPGMGLRWEAGFRTRFREAFANFDAVALLYATAYSEDLQHMLILEQWLSEEGHPTVLASPDHLKSRWRGARVLGTPIDAAFRFYPGEWMPRLPNFATWLRAAPELPMMNPLRHLVRQSKLMFALWKDEGSLDPSDRRLLEAHCPRTEPFGPEQLIRLRDEPDRWVLKRAFGRMGDSVVMGSLSSPRDWEAALKEASLAPSEWCIQERFLVRSLPFDAGPLYPALGAFVVNGRFAGYYSRAAPRPLTTHEAFHVGTVVRAA